MGGQVSLEFATTVEVGVSIFDIPEETAVRHDLRDFDPSGSSTASSPTCLQQHVLPETLDLPIGSIRLDRYELLEELVRGPVHSVFRARRLDNGEPVAVKVLRRRSPDSSAPERLGREWEIIRSLEHPHIVRAVDFGSEADTLSLVIEYLRGPALDRYVRESGPLPFATAADFICQAAEALAYAHAHGVVHRDVKPSNLLLTADGTIKVIDFGVAHAEDEESSLTLIHGEALIGTADYMAPEQSVNPHSVDDRADVYSLGCTLYYLLTGQAPYPNGSLVSRLLQHRNDPPPLVDLHRRDVPAELAVICERMMAKNPGERIGSMREVRDLLTDWLEKCGEEIAADKMVAG